MFQSWGITLLSLPGKAYATVLERGPDSQTSDSESAIWILSWSKVYKGTSWVVLQECRTWPGHYVKHQSINNSSESCVRKVAENGWLDIYTQLKSYKLSDIYIYTITCIHNLTYSLPLPYLLVSTVCCLGVM